MDSNIFAKTLRKNSTIAEQKLWKYLRRKDTGFKFRRQQAIGPYIVDFYCASKRLIIEPDGGQHTPEKDADRTAFLNKMARRCYDFGIMMYCKTQTVCII